MELPPRAKLQAISQREESVPPLDEVVALGLLLFAAVLGGFLAKSLRMPPLLGMLLAGMGLRNLPGDLLHDLPEEWSIALRLIALTVILLRAGLGLDLDALVGLRGSVIRLAFLPNLSEALTVAGMANLILDLPLIWGLLLGFVVAAVSPAVVVPSLLDLQQRGYGVAKGIPSMILAAATFDDVLSITGFGATLSLIFADQSDVGVVGSLLRAPLELGLGLGAGILAGLACGVVRGGPTWLRLGVLSGLGLSAVFGGWAIGFAGGGSLAAMTMAAVAARGWLDATPPVALGLGRMWAPAQPLLFGLIGAAVVFSSIEPRYVAFGLIILIVGLAVRLLVTYLSVSSADFSIRERLFVALAWIPKATVQAAIGALALDLARQNGSVAQGEIYGTQVLTIAVLAIVVTAPIGALAIAWCGPRWLDQELDSK